jgi:hypothetical protein
LTVCDLSGKTVATIVDEEKPAGVYEARWNAAVFSNGLYFLRMKAGGVALTRQLVLVK